MVDAARRAALLALNDVTERQAYAHLTAKKHFSALEGQDRRFAHELLMGTLERMVTLDWVLDQYIRSRRVHRVVRNGLRLGVYQILYLDRVPDAAACATTVELMRSVGKDALSGFVNGVLRSVAREARALPWPDRAADPVAYLSVRYSVPRWLAALWRDEMGEEEAEALLACPARSGLVLRVNPFVKGSETVERELTEKGYAYRPGALAPGALTVQAGELLRDELFHDGRVTVQGEASQWLAQVAAHDRPESIWDACAAPGGKTAALAAALGGKAHILATDVHPHRMSLVNRTLERLEVPGVTVSLHDATKSLDEDRDFDLVLVDAPCSGLGTYKNHPDILMRMDPGKIAALAALQRRILDNTARYVRPGGILLYSTCTLTRAEDEEQVAGFLSRHPQFAPEGIAGLPGLGGRFDGGIVRLTPHRDGTEGFFVARLRRSADPGEGAHGC
ncbi:MAG: 16S rRNA (cytosine(967)-C(5))-methyltransferase RsmB [Christensenellales bacterium]|jgi:16S rRNA (cytosine967-C5)-methyltransferase